LCFGFGATSYQRQAAPGDLTTIKISLSAD
jgi:hypothetical protein